MRHSRRAQLAAALALSLAADPAGAQVAPVTGGTVVEGATIRLRNLLPGGASGDEVFVGLLANLGSAAGRDAFNGNWSVPGGEYSPLTFTLTWNAGARRLDLSLGSQLGGLARTGDAAGVASTYGAGRVGIEQVGRFDLLRLFGRAGDARLDRAEVVYADGSGFDLAPGLAFSSAPLFWQVDDARDFVLSGTVEGSTCAGESCRWEFGVAASGPMTAPEPASTALLATGLGLMAVATRRRRIA